MSENLNLTELIEELQAIVDAGRFEYTPTNIESVKYINGLTGGYVEFSADFPDGAAADMQRDIDNLQDDLNKAERKAESFETALHEAVEEIARLKNLP